MNKETDELRNKQSIMARKYQMTKIQLTRQFNEKARKMREETASRKEELLKPYKENYMDCTRRIRNLENIFLNGTGNKKYKKQVEERINGIIQEREKIKDAANKIEREEELKVNTAIEEIRARINDKMEEIRLELSQDGIQLEKVEIKEIRNQTEKTALNTEKNANKNNEKTEDKDEEKSKDKKEDKHVTNEEEQKDDETKKAEEDNHETQQNQQVGQSKNKKEKVNLFSKIIKSITSPIRKIIKSNNKEKVELLNAGGYEQEKENKTQGFEDMLDELGIENEKQDREEQRRENLHMDKEEQPIDHEKAIEKVEGEILTPEEVKKVYGDQEK